jgi:hypothetical protein
LLPWVAPSIFSMGCLKDAQVARAASRRRSAPPSGERRNGLLLAGGSPPRPASQATPLHEAPAAGHAGRRPVAPRPKAPHAAAQQRREPGAFRRGNAAAQRLQASCCGLFLPILPKSGPWKAATAGPFSASGFSAASSALPLPSLHLPAGQFHSRPAFFIFPLPEFHSLPFLPPSSFPASISKGTERTLHSSDGSVALTENQTRLSRNKGTPLFEPTHDGTHTPIALGRLVPATYLRTTPSSRENKKTRPCINAYASWSPAALPSTHSFVDPFVLPYSGLPPARLRRSPSARRPVRPNPASASFTT